MRMEMRNAHLCWRVMCQSCFSIGVKIARGSGFEQMWEEQKRGGGEKKQYSKPRWSLGGMCGNDKRPELFYQSGRCYKKVAATYSPTFYRSTIGAEGLNFSVRNGKRWTPSL